MIVVIGNPMAAKAKGAVEILGAGVGVREGGRAAASTKDVGIDNPVD